MVQHGWATTSDLVIDDIWLDDATTIAVEEVLLATNVRVRFADPIAARAS